MRCIDATDVKKWAETSGIQFDHSLSLSKAASSKGVEIFPNESKCQLLGLARMMVEWFPPSLEKLLVISESTSYPPDKDVIIRRIRGMSDNVADVGVMPGTIIRATRVSGEDYERRNGDDIDEESALLWLSYFTMLFAWSGDLVARASVKHVHFGDGFCAFRSDTYEHIGEVKEFAASAGLRVREL